MRHPDEVPGGVVPRRAAAIVPTVVMNVLRGRVLSCFACLLALPAVALAQEPPRGQRLVEITRGNARETVSTMACYQHGVAPARNGALFVLVVRATLVGPAPGHGSSYTSELELWRSDDRGGTWRRAQVAPTRGASDGAIVPDGEGLACAWSASDGGAWANAYWQRYDVARDAWLGEPVRLTTATGDEDQYFVTDLARAANGALVVAIGSHRSPPAPTWNCGWSTGMRWLRAGSSEWSPLQQANVDSYGCCGNLLVRGDVVDFTYRSCPSEAVHALRSFDTAKAVWIESEPITPRDPPAGSYTANTGIWCADGTGGRALFHLVGDHRPGNGRLVVSFARAGGPFVTTTVADDPPLQAGNENATHFTLARGPGNQVLAYFSKASEQFADLWQVLLEDGVPVGQPKQVVKGAPQQFVLLNGMRIGEAHCGLHVVATSRNERSPGGVVAAFGTWPARTVWLDGKR